MKNKIFASMVLLALLTACDDNYNNQFGDIEYTPIDVKNVEITLGSSDYAAIAALEANKELALAKDPEGGYYLEALAAVGTNKYFTDDITADEFLPAFLADKYPHADFGSKFTVIYNQYEGPSSYLADFANITSYTLTTDDYKAVWGNSISAKFLSPASLNKIPSLLGENVKNAEAGDMVVVNYAYSETEPSTGGSTASVVYKQVADFAGAGNYVIASLAGDGNWYPFGKLKAESYTYGYMYPAAISVTDGLIGEDEGQEQVMTVEQTAAGFALKNAWNQYLYMDESHNSYNVASSLPAEGGDWIFNKNNDGTYSIVNVLSGKTVKLNLYNGSYSFGAYPTSSFGGSVYLEASFQENSYSDFTVQDVELPEGSTYVWSTGSSYIKASAYVGGANRDAESWLVSGEIDLTSATAPQLSVDIATRFFSPKAPEDFLTLAVSTDYAGDVTTATWTPLTITEWSDGSSWTFVNTGALDLSAFKGEKIVLGIRYVSTTEASATMELRDLVVQEAPKPNYWDVCLFQEMTGDEAAAAAPGRAVTRAAAVSANAAALYQYDGSAWSEYVSADAKVSVVDVSVYESLGTDVIEDPAYVLPIYLARKYPYAAEGEKVAVVYNKSTDTPAVVEYTFNAGWAETPVAVAATLVFMKEVDGISANMSVYLQESLLGDTGGFTIQDINTGGLNFIWTNTNNYGWKASGYLNGTNYTSESWIVSPSLSFKKAVAPYMTFEEAHRFLGAGDAPTKYLNVLISTNYKGDVTTCDWDVLPVENWSAGTDWTFVNVGNIDLSAYVGNTNVRIAFRYTSDAEVNVAATWEVKNLLVREPETGEE